MLFRGSQDRGHHLGIQGFAGCQATAVLDEVDDIGAGDLLGVEGVETQEGLAGHVGGQPVAIDHLRLIPEEFLLHPDPLDALDQAAGEQVGIGPDDLVDFLVEQLEIDRGVLDIVAGGLAGIAALVLAVDQLTVGDIGIGVDAGVADPLAVVLDHRHALGDQAEAKHLVGAPHLAGDAVPHRQLHRQHPREEIGAAAVGGAAVLGPGLAEDRQVAGDGDVGGHADLLAAGHPHAVDSADRRLLAAQNPVDHGVEQIHVDPVLVRPFAVVLGILLDVAAGAEGLVAGGGEHRRHHRAIGRGPVETGDDRLDHLGGV